jgi:hypothetical protein
MQLLESVGWYRESDIQEVFLHHSWSDLPRFNRVFRISKINRLTPLVVRTAYEHLFKQENRIKAPKIRIDQETVVLEDVAKPLRFVS